MRNWVFTKAEEIFSITYGKDFRKKDLDLNGAYPVYGANGIIGYHSKYTTKNKELIIGCRGTVGNTLLTRFPSYITHNSLVLMPFGPLSKEYFKYAIDATNKDSVITGSSQPQITIENFEKLTIPIAPLNEQRRIVAKLEKLMTKLDQCKVRLEKIPSILKHFRQSVLAAACSGGLTRDWREENPPKIDMSSSLKSIGKKRRQEYYKLCNEAHKKGEKTPKKPAHFEPKIFTPDELSIPDSWFWTSIEDLASVRRYSLSSGPFGSK
jgi:type I restriction enzyme S subunit